MLVRGISLMGEKSESGEKGTSNGKEFSDQKKLQKIPSQFCERLYLRTRKDLTSHLLVGSFYSFCLGGFFLATSSSGVWEKVTSKSYTFFWKKTQNFQLEMCFLKLTTILYNYLFGRMLLAGKQFHTTDAESEQSEA